MKSECSPATLTISFLVFSESDANPFRSLLVMLSCFVSLCSSAFLFVLLLDLHCSASLFPMIAVTLQQLTDAQSENGSATRAIG
jgi:hypothetical protein